MCDAVLSLDKRAVTLQIAAGSVCVTKSGEGPPAMFVHGLAGSTAWWNRNADVLSRSHTTYRVDLPGFGSMRKNAGHFSLAASVAWLAEVMRALNLDHAAIIGHSMGALIAAMFAASYPQSVSKLVLAAPAIGLPHKTLPAYFAPLLRQAAYVQPAFAPTLVRDAARAGLATLIRAGRELVRVDIDTQLDKITSPCLLLFGDRDPLVPPSAGPWLHSKIKGSSLLVLPRAGHILMYDRADLFNKALLDFLSTDKHQAVGKA